MVQTKGECLWAISFLLLPLYLPLYLVLLVYLTPRLSSPHLDDSGREEFETAGFEFEV